VALQLIESADVLLEGLRPGVTERLGLGPEDALRRNPRLVYGRMTGWGQVGPYSQMAGHDINYIALAGLLHGIGRAESPPAPPLSYVGDFGGGSMFLVFGVLSALLERQASGLGQVVDAAMVDGAASLSALNFTLRAQGSWSDERGGNMLDGSSPHYDTYECADGAFVAIGPQEHRFYTQLRELLGLADDALWGDQWDRALWPQRKIALRDLFRTRTRTEWCSLLEYTDTCFAPVLDFSEVEDHPHLAERQTYVNHFGVLQPAPAPRLDRTPGTLTLPPPAIGEHTDQLMKELGYELSSVEGLRRKGAIG
jgi:alpha-methylacyl-CoA racemase